MKIHDFSIIEPIKSEEKIESKKFTVTFNIYTHTKKKKKGYTIIENLLQNCVDLSVYYINIYPSTNLSQASTYLFSILHRCFLLDYKRKNVTRSVISKHRRTVDDG